MDEDNQYPEFRLDCNHFCHLSCLRQYLDSSISFCPDLDCRVPILSIEGVPVEARYSRVDPDFSESLSRDLIESLLEADTRVLRSASSASLSSSLSSSVSPFSPSGRAPSARSSISPLPPSVSVCPWTLAPLPEVKEFEVPASFLSSSSSSSSSSSPLLLPLLLLLLHPPPLPLPLLSLPLFPLPPLPLSPLPPPAPLLPLVLLPLLSHAWCLVVRGPSLPAVLGPFVPIFGRPIWVSFYLLP